MKSDSELRRDVEAELHWSPDVDATDLAVNVHGGVVALTGYVQSYYEKYRAEDAVKRVAGVAGVANDVVVHVGHGRGLDDPQIARAAVAAVRAQYPAGADNVKVLVHQGHVTLEGTVEWNYQRERIEEAIGRLPGITAVSNTIAIQPHVAPAEVKRLIEDAFRRSAVLDAEGISITADGGRVTLRGRVRTWTERNQAQQTAWCAPGVTEVKNELSVAA
jgi:osmotically-inducible protein OsmY